MTKAPHPIIALLLLLFSIFPMLAVAITLDTVDVDSTMVSHWRPGDPLVLCETEANPGPCNFIDLMMLARNLVDIAFYLATFLAVVTFSYAGFLYVTAGGNPGRLRKAHGIFTKVAIGFIIVLSAWLVVSAIVKTLAPETSLLG